MGQRLVVQGLGPGRVRRRRHRLAEDWIIAPRTTGTASATWPGFNMLDPIKATIVNPGLSLDGKFDEASRRPS
jgi:arginine decarboxylase